MKADFSGYATKAGLRCSDGRTIMPNAFAHQDELQVPLVWQHGHSDPENVLGHAVLEKRDDGMYAYGFFNTSAKAEHARNLLEHKDIKMLSIWANDLIERSGKVLHGAIREVSLVLSGANPGAIIDNVTIRHSDDTISTVEDEAIIYTGLELTTDDAVEHATATDANPNTDTEVDDDNDDSDDSDDDDGTLKDIYDSMTPKQQEVLKYMVGQALEAGSRSAEEADSTTNDGNIKQDNLASDAANTTTKEGTEVTTKNVFEQGADDSTKAYALTHSDIEAIVSDATRRGSLKDAVEGFALEHGITDVDLLFPEAQAVGIGTPEFNQRRTEWVNSVLSATSKSPFARVKTLSADITLEDARAKGYVTGALKREEFFGVQKRVTTPTTIYKKQKLDRDDMIDITDFDVVAWLKGEMRLMLDEELARAILIGDGRDVAHDDKINEGNIRPIAHDHELYATTLNVNLGDLNSSAQEIIDAIIANRKHYKGSGMPTFYTTETVISQFMLLKDTLGRRLYANLDDVARELRVKEVVPVDVLEGDASIVGVIVNMSDYVIGADRGGNVSMFDDFDIDYNQYKYLIETRVSGALTKLKSALVIKKVADASLLATPTAPTFNTETGVVTIPTVTGVGYFNETDDPDFSSELTAGAQTAIAAGATVKITAVPDSGYHFANNADDSWFFTREA